MESTYQREKRIEELTAENEELKKRLDFVEYQREKRKANDLYRHHRGLPKACR